MAATLPAGVGSRPVVVRLKHLPRQHSQPEPKPVHQRCVDELRGACLRAGAGEGLLVCTGGFSLTARRLAALDRSGIAPVRLVDGEELTELLLHRRLGVREAFAFPGRRRLELDEGFFRALRRQEAGPEGKQASPTAPTDASKLSRRTDAPAVSAWHVTVRLVTPRPGIGRDGGRNER